MSLSLRVRVLLLVMALNTALFGAGLWLLSRQAENARQEYAAQTIDALLRRLAANIAPQSELSVSPILAWSLWDGFDDALVMRASWERDEHGRIRPLGALLNPRGRWARAANYDVQPRLEEIVGAIEHRPLSLGTGGIAVPIPDNRGNVWGGLWLPLPGVAHASLVTQLLPFFGLSLLLLTLGVFFVLRRSVLDPLGELASAAGRVKGGDLATRLPEPARKDEIGQLIRSFNEMTSHVQGFNARLEQEVENATAQARRAEAAALTQRRLAAMGELAAGIAHEINNPLGGLLNAVESLERGKLPPEKHARYFELLRNGLERIQATVGRLLRFTPRAAPVGPLSLARALEDALELVAHRARGLGVDLALVSAVPGEPREHVLARWHALPPLSGERGELAQAVLNLLVNALDALEDDGLPGGRIELSLEREGEELHLRVRDDGPGVAPENLSRIADLFFSTKEVGRGTGLGLSIVHKVVAAHGGRVFLSNASGGGFCVDLHLPLTGREDA
ncbi:MAG: HAMP domain-containing histidine kinase [Planctomycetes bacterium]|nr:HAMP domain-containing histidine kinase [Planctomycetota bacterium]